MAVCVLDFGDIIRSGSCGRAKLTVQKGASPLVANTVLCEPLGKRNAGVSELGCAIAMVPVGGYAQGIR